MILEVAPTRLHELALPQLFALRSSPPKLYQVGSVSLDWMNSSQLRELYQEFTEGS